MEGWTKRASIEKASILRKSRRCSQCGAVFGETMRLTDGEEVNYGILRECVSDPIVQSLSQASSEKVRKSKKSKQRKQTFSSQRHETDTTGPDECSADDLTDYINYIATELFDAFPMELRSLSHTAIANDSKLAARYTIDPLPPSTTSDLLALTPAMLIDTLAAYSPTIDPPAFLSQILTSYISSATTPPPPPTSQSLRRTGSACEICSRSWIPLTYHHLIPRQVHAKTLKRNWHPESALLSVAWLCRACHSFVHRAATNEELAREWYTVELLLEREDVRIWSQWIGRVRWKSR